MKNENFSTVSVGIGERALSVPLFAELYGYGPFKGRRNRGTRDPLYVRALSFNDGTRRNIIIVTDCVVTDNEEAAALRRRIARKYGIEPDGILIAATHTHSGPAMSMGIGWGEKDEKFLRHWRKTVLETAGEALADEEAVKAFGGVAELSQKLGINRVNAEWATDPTIRWIQFKRNDGSVKILFHNHGMHGVVFGPKNMFVSADWMGEANRLIRERKLADKPFFLYGAAGDVNTNPCCCSLEDGDPEIIRIGKSYVDDLEKSIAAGGKELNLLPLKNSLKKTLMPTVDKNAEQMREDAAIAHTFNGYLGNRLEEMAILYDQGQRFPVKLDLQALQMGDLAIYAFPGEPFVKLGKRIMEESPFPFALAAGVANGNGRYFPTVETFDMFPQGIALPKQSYGFYEIHQGAGRFMPQYQKNIADFIVSSLLKLKLK